MPAPKPPEFRRRSLDLVAQGAPVAQAARNLGSSESCLHRWMTVDDVDSGRKGGPDQCREAGAGRAALQEPGSGNRERDPQASLGLLHPGEHSPNIAFG